MHAGCIVGLEDQWLQVVMSCETFVSGWARLLCREKRVPTPFLTACKNQGIRVAEAWDGTGSLLVVLEDWMTLSRGVFFPFLVDLVPEVENPLSFLPLFAFPWLQLPLRLPLASRVSICRKEDFFTEVHGRLWCWWFVSFSAMSNIPICNYLYITTNTAWPVLSYYYYRQHEIFRKMTALLWLFRLFSLEYETGVMENRAP